MAAYVVAVFAHFAGRRLDRIGAFTQRSLVAFQRDEGIMETCELDGATIVKLGIA